MTRLVIAPGALRDLKRLTDLLAETNSQAAMETGDVLMRGLEILREHPLVGRVVEEGYRELVISRGRTGYVALYRHGPVQDTTLVLAVRHQRGQGYADA